MEKDNKKQGAVNDGKVFNLIGLLEISEKEADVLSSYQKEVHEKCTNHSEALLEVAGLSKNPTVKRPKMTAAMNVAMLLTEGMVLESMGRHARIVAMIEQRVG